MGRLHVAGATTCLPQSCPGLILSGGSIETFPKANCSIPWQPGRGGQTLSLINEGRKLVICGGGELTPATQKSCIAWRPQQLKWTEYATLSKEWMYHAAVVMENDNIILVGGQQRHDSHKRGEIVKSGVLFDLKTPGKAACALAINKTMFITIGGKVDISWTTHGKVDRYDNMGNYLDSLPDLNIRRYGHACSLFQSKQEQGIMVVGGVGRSATIIRSTELFLPSNNRWIMAQHLPRNTEYLRASHLDNLVVVTGDVGHGGELGWNTSSSYVAVFQYDAVADTWTQIGRMESLRFAHGVVAANLSAIGCTAYNAKGAAAIHGVSRFVALLIGFGLAIVI